MLYVTGSTEGLEPVDEAYFEFTTLSEADTTSAATNLSATEGTRQVVLSWDAEHLGSKRF